MGKGGNIEMLPVLFQGQKMNKPSTISGKSMQAGYVVVGAAENLLDVSPKTTVRRAIRVVANAGVAIWLLSLASMAIA
jgi:hypothetical protein